MEALKCIYEDKVNHRFSLLMDSVGDIRFCYWTELKKFSVTQLTQNHSYLMQFQDITQPDNCFRGIRLSALQVDGPAVTANTAEFTGIKFTSQSLAALFASSADKTLIFYQCEFEEIHLSGLHFEQDLLFCQCTFLDNFRLTSSTFSKSVWFPHCTFYKHFSLKASQLAGSVHLESVCFYGEGGLSLRGVCCRNIYLDLGVKGPADMVWLNEVSVAGVLSIGGDFRSEIQLFNRQDEVSDSKMPVGHLCIGTECYQNEKANLTRSSADIRVFGYEFETVAIQNVELNALYLSDLTAKNVTVLSSHVQKDIELKNMKVMQEVSLSEVMVARNLKLENCDIQSRLSLANSSVSQCTYLEDLKTAKNEAIDLYRFISDRFYTNVPELFVGKAKFKFFSPREFAGLVKHSSSKSMEEQYSNLKHWFHDTGKLAYEDMAFFHMRDMSAAGILTKFFLGRVFGWGVRISNIALSSAIVIMLFAALYFLSANALSVKESFLLSIQSFSGAFFGSWAASLDSKNDLLFLVALQSYVGVFFITTFVGAYIRKLLR
ncbi:hypothetical protein [Rheinheimera sp. 1928-s]|uniref:hypothetical protein n=1 Tax=Rheinheimera sp. 1928-s TaxID=3033803 RepID=UPI00262B21F9|nr:hypothetical protein [Rheinheimera sp. 1928-s]MDF3125926.1 hypothetical protein [Rheinheimera sp. 1928-s]